MTTHFVSLFDRVADLMDYAPLFDLGLAERSDLEEAVRAAKSTADLPEPFAGWLNTAQKNKSLLDGMNAIDAGETVKHSQIIKGGPGSGNYGHAGIPGQQGGSKPTDGIEDAKTPKTTTTYPSEMEFADGRVKMEGDLNALKDYGLTPEDIAEISDLHIDGAVAEIKVSVEELSSFNRLEIKGVWRKPKTGIHLGGFKRFLSDNRRSGQLQELWFNPLYTGRGVGMQVARGWYNKLADAGFAYMGLHANSTVGRYAWAKEGAQYLPNSGAAKNQTAKFAEWIKKRNIPGYDDSSKLPTFTTPQDIANYKHPDGYTLTAAQIRGNDLKQDVPMHLGKAFMLDETGHGSWDAVVYLDNWKSKANKSAVKVAVSDLIVVSKKNKRYYVETSRENPDVSDALFWSQYLDEDEGDPIFGFPDETTERGKIIKGGPGSGNRGHIGRPGGRGGSAPSYFDHRISNEKIAQLKHRNPSATVEIVTLTPRQQETYAELYESLKKLGSAGWARIQAIEREAKFAPLILGGNPQSWWVEDGAYRLAIIAHRGKSNFFAFFNTLPTGPTKGGPGSGNHGHDGIPGHQGGSKPGDGTDDDLSASHRMELSNGRVVISGDLGRLKEFGLTPQYLEDLSDLGVDNVQTQIEVTVKGRGDRYLEIKGEWDRITQLEHIGNFERTLDRTEMTATMSALHLKSAYMGQGNGTKVARNWYQKLADAGYQKATLFANSTVGMYAWAREGAQYAYANQPAHQTRKFAEWVKSKKIPGLEGALPTFSNPQDVADYYHPEGYSVKGSQIDNAAVKPDAVLHLGKAFMLDSAGHSAWDAIINLADWKGRSRKSVAVADLITENDDNDLCYVDMDHSIPGASDAVFFAQYLSADEGSPIFGFIEGSTNKRSKIIKGGPGSGNHGHRGIQGEQGGSMPTDGKPRSGGVGNGGTNRFFQGRVTLKGDLEHLKAYGVQPKDIAEISYLDNDIDTVITVINNSSGEEYGDAYLTIEGVFTDRGTGEYVGDFVRYLASDGEVATLETLSFRRDYMNRGFGKKVTQGWYGVLADAGYKRAEFLADLTIGKYAWAKEGAQYAYPKKMAKEINEKFAAWSKQKGIPGFHDRRNRPIFKTPQDVANYKHGRAYKVKGSEITNKDVDPNAEFHVGKAFMLDDNGHGDWGAVMDLQNWKGKKGKALKAVLVADLVGDEGAEDETCYVQVGRDFPGGSDAIFFTQYLSEDEGEPIFGFGEGSTNKRGQIIKGGEGSGNHGHAGIPGHQGGSKPTGSDSVVSRGTITWEAKPTILRRYGLTAADIEKACDLGIDDVNTSIKLEMQADGLHIVGGWSDSKTGDFIGVFERALKSGSKEVELTMLSFQAPYVARGLGTTVAHNWFAMLADAGYEKATLQADLTIGRYAWAKEGAEFAYASQAEDATNKFAKWVKSKKIPGMKGKLPTFTNPKDIANYQHPDGYTLTTADIKNRGVRPDTVMHLGKAFMLDEKGHGDWDAVINLKDWSERNHKSISVLNWAGKAIVAEDLIGESSTGYVYASRKIVGGSDEIFWSQYAGADEGEPMFGFSETTLKLGGRIVKGGQGSGNFGHKGRKGQRGGSDNDGVPNDGIGGGTLTAGEMTSVGASSGEARSPVNFEDPRYVESSITGYTQGSPGLSKVVNSSDPLPAQYLTTPAGQARGSQFLPQMMKDMGIDKNLPDQKSLTHGAKSLYLELTDDEELNRLLSKVPPDPAHSSGFWVPGKAAGGGAHGQLKKDAKEGDGKKLEKARKKEEARVKPLMMSAVVQAAMTNDYSLANALQVHYQLVGNLGTFSLLMGYSTINMGASLGTIVMDRGEIEVDPEIVTRIPVGYGTGRDGGGRGGYVVPGGRSRKRSKIIKAGK